MVHAIFDITGCQHADADPEAIMTAMRRTADHLSCTTRAQVIEPFQPHGATCVLILAESHITVFTWPEHQLAHIDVFTCRADTSPGRAIQPILDLLAGQVTHTQNVPRTPREASCRWQRGGNTRLDSSHSGAPGLARPQAQLAARRSLLRLRARSQ